MDDTTFDFVKPLLVQYNEIYNDNVRFENIIDYQIHRYLKPECENVFKDVVDDDFIYNLKPMQDAKQIIDWLNKHYDVYFASAGHPSTMKARDKLLSKTFDWYSTRQLIRCVDKWVLDFDVLIDDCIDNLLEFKSAKVLMSRPWNEDIDITNSVILRADNWIDILDLFH